MRILATVLAVISAVIMLASGIMKLVNSGFRSDMDAVYEIGGNQFGTWFFLLVGLFEVLIAVLLFIPRFRTLGAIDLIIVMVGAAVFNLAFVKDIIPAGLDDPSNFVIVNIILALVGAAIAFLWRRHTVEHPVALRSIDSPMMRRIDGT